MKKREARGGATSERTNQNLKDTINYSTECIKLFLNPKRKHIPFPAEGPE